MQPGPMNKALQPIKWLIGKWHSVSANGNYPTIKPFTFYEEIEFKSFGQPLLNYVTSTWHNVSNKQKNNIPLNLEAGFLRIKPDTNEVAFMLSHNLGITTVEHGHVVGTCIDLKWTDIGRMSFVRTPLVIETTRLYKYCCSENLLHMQIKMATENTPLTEYIRVTYKKVLRECK